ncbi:MAG: hypothetical protein DCC75_06320 [Proteobacteria bacterium]|nr:MAG: hypothetical protein DCC75_06320 [Pseudomonadota bacterium]
MQLSQSGGPDPQKQTTPAQPGSDKAAASGENDAQHIIDSIIGNFCTKESNLCERLGARLLQELQHRDPAVVAEMRNLARQSLSLPPIDLKGADLDPANINEAHVIALGDEERALIIQRMLEKAAQIFPADEVARIATEVLTQDRRPSIADLSQLASGTVYIPQLRQAIREFFELPKPEAALDEGDLLATRSGLISKLVSDDPRFLRIAQHHITVEVVRGILDRSVGFDSVSPIGGKAAGMILANLVVKKNGSNRPENSLPIAMPTSRFIRADVVEAFFDCNGLDRFHRLKFKEDPNEIRAGYEELRSLLVSLKFPGAIWDKLGKIVSAFGVSPIVVRSSSLLEDRLGTAFAGKYKSVFLANQGTHEDKLLALVGAVMEVYASTVSPDAILYRKQRDLLHFREQMGILIQNAVAQ